MRSLYAVLVCLMLVDASAQTAANAGRQTPPRTPAAASDPKLAFPLPAPHSGNKHWWTGFCSVDTKEEYASIVKSLNDYRTDDSQYQMDVVSTYLSRDDLYTAMPVEQSWELFASMPFKDKRGALNMRLFLPPRALLVIACNIIPCTKGISNARGANPGIWDEIPTGKYDIYYRQWARNLTTVLQSPKYLGASIELNRVVLRMAWEFNWQSFAHCAQGNCEGFKRSWQHLVAIYRQELPGVRFELHPVTTKKVLTKKDGAYYSYAELDPGPEYVDFYGMAFHEGYPTVSSDTIFDNRMKGTKTEHGYNEAMEHAKKMKRLFACGEWSPIMLAKRGTKRGTERSDLMIGNPDYMIPSSRGWFNWLYQNRQYVAYEAFFHASAGPITSPTWDCAQMYRKLWMSDNIRR